MKEIVKELFSKLDVMAFIVGATILLCFAVITWALIKLPIPIENRDSLSILLGIIAGGVSALVNYYFGSSKGSQKKTDLIDKITDQTTK